MDFFVPFFGVVAVGIGRGDVEVAEQDEFGVCGHFGADELGQCGKPLFFVLEFWAVQQAVACISTNHVAWLRHTLLAGGTKFKTDV